MYDAAADLLRGSGCVGCGRGGRLLCRDCVDLLPVAARPSRPTPCPTGLVPAYAAGEYAGLLRDLVLGHKERALLPLARPLGLLLALAVAAAMSIRAPGTGAVVLVPVPSRRSVVRARGHEPTWQITRSAAAHLRAVGYDALAHRLLRVRDPVLDQSGLDAGERALNLAGSMRCPSSAVAALGRRRARGHPVVCDDVLTTGATVREAQRALEVSGLRPTGIAVVAATRRRTLPARSPAGAPDPSLVLRRTTD